MTARSLRIAEDLRLPLDWMTLATIVYGARGSGKTTLGAVIAEEITKAGQRFCAIDLKGDWYGLKSSADGTTEGIPAIIFGGDHKDVPLEENAGAEVGEIVAGLEQSAILDLEYFSKGKQVRFLAAFFERLYDRNREPLVLLLDEAQRYAPQKPISPDATICLGMVEDLVKLGRKHGIGPVLFTQRGSGLNKEVSELCDLLVAFRTPGPLDQDRIKDWLDANTTKQQRDQVMGQLSGLATGTAVFASGHPDLKTFQVAHVRRRETFDSSATPKVGQRRKEPRRLAKPDLEALQARMSAAIERAKQEDPKELRRRIQELEREIRKGKPAPATAPVVKEVEKRVEVAVLKDGQVARFEKATERLAKFGEQLPAAIAAAVRPVVDVGRDITAALARFHQPGNGGAPRRVGLPSRAPITPARRTLPAATGTRQAPRQPDVPVGDGQISGVTQKILDALAELEALGSDEPQKELVAILAGYTNLASKGFANAIGAARSDGLITYPTGGKVALTDVGRALAAGVEAYPEAVDKTELAAAAGYGNLASKGFANAIGRLRSLGFIEYPGSGQVKARPVLFLEGG